MCAVFDITLPRTRSERPDLFKNKAASVAATRPPPDGSTCARIDTDLRKGHGSSYGTFLSCEAQKNM